MWISGAVGSKPSLIRNGTPVASDLDSFATQSASGNSSSQERWVVASASSTRSVIGYFAAERGEVAVADMEAGCGKCGAVAGGPVAILRRGQTTVTPLVGG